MKVVVVGAGYVGLVAACCLSDAGHEVVSVETDADKLRLLREGITPIREPGIEGLLSEGLASRRLSFQGQLPCPLDAEVAMIAVGTPSLPSGATDLSHVYRAVSEVSEATQERVILIMKSTVPPGTGRKIMRRHLNGRPIDYVSNPEFLREGQAVDDWYNPSRVVIGADRPEAAATTGKLYQGITAPRIITDITSAETVKYAANAFLATRISFINEIANLCEVVGASIDDVARGIGLDPRIGPDFLRPGLGYGGSCFPKDTRALDFSALNNGYDFRLLKSTIEVNAKQAIMAVRKMARLLDGLEGREITILGLAFKPETDDVRESPALSIASLLAEHGARLRAYDPAAMYNARPLLPEGVALASGVHAAICGAQAVCLATDWPEFLSADWESIKDAMSPPYVVFDGRNALPYARLKALGFRYAGIGR